MKYDYLVVGAGLFGSVFAYEASKRGKKVLVIDKRNHIAGNLFTQNEHGIDVHQYGAHIFHTSNKAIWAYVNQFDEFNHYRNEPLALFQGKLYNLPFNMNTFYQLWGVMNPQEAEAIIHQQRKQFYKPNPKNLEEQAINLVGPEIYEKLIKGYTEKQWGKDCTELPISIIKRLPVRFRFDNNYFDDSYQGIPKHGYTYMIKQMLSKCDVRLNMDFFENKILCESLASKIVYTGPIDQFYQYQFGPLEYRSLRFEHETLNSANYQGNAVVNYTEKCIPYTRVIEHKHFMFGTQPHTIITKEYPEQWSLGKEPYYPVNDAQNQLLYAQYYEKSLKEKEYYFGGRLAEYKYYDMHMVIESALKLVEEVFLD
ncbi:UDP-galactopyranose mutase [Methanobacterium sp. YSL]|nr:UDP-galactopyranose mutase [Methanobacterium sp. YSL]